MQKSLLTMTPAQKILLAQRFNYACGYCGTTEIEVGATLTVDHFQPSSQDGADAIENWVYSCFACNIFKGDYWPQNDDFALLRPLEDDFSLHWRQMEDGSLVPLTDRGRFHIEKLHLDRPQLENKRRERGELQAERDKTRSLELERNELEQQVAQLTRDIFGE